MRKGQQHLCSYSTERPVFQAQRSKIPKKHLRATPYCRVSTDSEEQLNSYNAQIAYYTEKIAAMPEWTMARLYAGEGISGTSMKQRKEFMKMLRDCDRGKIDLVITKPVSRFRRNALDGLDTVRKLNRKGIGVFFEKENVNTLYMDNGFQRFSTDHFPQQKQIFRVSGISWWPQELPSGEEYEEALRNLERVNWCVDCILTRCAPIDIQQKLDRNYAAGHLTDFLQTLRQRCQFDDWFLGHYHRDCTVAATKSMSLKTQRTSSPRLKQSHSPTA